MRTTLLLDTKLFRLAKERAAKEGTSLSQLVNEALKDKLLLPKRNLKESFQFKWATKKGKLLPGVDLSDRDSLYEKMENRS